MPRQQFPVREFGHPQVTAFPTDPNDERGVIHEMGVCAMLCSASRYELIVQYVFSLASRGP